MSESIKRDWHWGLPILTYPRQYWPQDCHGNTDQANSWLCLREIDQGRSFGLTFAPSLRIVWFAANDIKYECSNFDLSNMKFITSILKRFSQFPATLQIFVCVVSQEEMVGFRLWIDGSVVMVGKRWLSGRKEPSYLCNMDEIINDIDCRIESSFYQ